MRQPGAHGKDSERGQVSVEFLGTLPAALLLALLGWQLVLAGQAIWLAGNAARVAARAQAVGSDPVAAARSSLPGYFRRHARIATGGGDGQVNVRIRVPFLLARWSTPLELSGSAALDSQDPGP
jgi:pilus assembly protein CpaE